MQRTTKSILALAAVPLLGVAALRASPEPSSATPGHLHRAQLIVGNGGEDDRLVIDDLETLKAGGAAYVTGGKRVLATRDEQGVEPSCRRFASPTMPAVCGRGRWHRAATDQPTATESRLRIERQGALAERPAGDRARERESTHRDPWRGGGPPDGRLRRRSGGGRPCRATAGRSVPGRSNGSSRTRILSRDDAAVGPRGDLGSSPLASTRRLGELATA
jgi:hypothetical protein